MAERAFFAKVPANFPQRRFLADFQVADDRGLVCKYLGEERTLFARLFLREFAKH